MFKGRQEILAVGELAVFVLAWTLCVVAALGNYRAQTNPGPGNTLAESSSNSETPDAVE